MFAENIKEKSNSFDNYAFPSEECLRKSDYIKVHDDVTFEIERTAKRILEFFEERNIKIFLDHIDEGVSVVRYAIKLGKDVKAISVVKLEEDLSLALAVGSLRIVAPIPGRSLIGIEVPKSILQNLCLGELISSEEFKSAESKVTVCLGRDIEGKNVIFNLANAPHILIGGSMGMGKTTLIHNIITSILFKAKPDEVKLVLCDPKMFELGYYSSLPHLYTPKIHTLKEVVDILKHLTNETERRYDLFNKLSTRNIDEYNEASDVKLPRIVVIFDEFADFIIQDRKQFIDHISALMPKSGPVGIHIILASARSELSVFDSLLTSNTPTRICLKQPNKTASGICLSCDGAEKLLSRGDSLMRISGSSAERVQVPFISDEEVIEIVNAIKNQPGMPSSPEYVYVSDEAQKRSPEEEYPCGDIDIDAFLSGYDDEDDEISFWREDKDDAEDYDINWPELMKIARIAVKKSSISCMELEIESSLDDYTINAGLKLLYKFGLIGESNEHGFHPVYLTQAGWNHKVGELVSSGIARAMMQKNEPGCRYMISELSQYVDDIDFLKACSLVCEFGQCTTSYLQRHLKIDFSKAAEIINTMENIGIISDTFVSNPRVALITAEQWNSIRDQARGYAMANKDKAAARKKALHKSDSEEMHQYINDTDFLEAVDIALDQGQISTALLQRKLSIGFSKAIRFIDYMESLGVVGEKNGAKPRNVLITKEEWVKIYNKLSW